MTTNEKRLDYSKPHSELVRLRKEIARLNDLKKKFSRKYPGDTKDQAYAMKKISEALSMAYMDAALIEMSLVDTA